MTRERAFGYQLLLDLYDCRDGVCDDLGHCYQFLEEAVDELRMEKQSPPSIFRSDATRFPDKAGLSGWVPLIESSIVIHTLLVKNFISIDIYCCRCFDIRRAKTICRRFFSPRRMIEQFIERGHDYYKDSHHYPTLAMESKEAGSPKDATDKKVTELTI